ncbi:outer membrane protein assembly factor BamE [Thioclava sp. GXIMD4216]|uniref:Outer membrane protein assembly factor BamE n=1 Tax=Thioclava litoralis TaxID=3076557 RepID=A0ABZ1E278_9RHOB|nr:outer membrane protein assembly factor BamE [Thioclava sp. FTW29]
MSIGFAPRRLMQGVALCAVIGLGACSPIYRNHGYVPTEEDLSQVQVGKTTKDDLDRLIGRPSSSGVLEGSDWYYVGSRWKRVGWGASHEIDRQVLAVSFNKAGVVSGVERYTLKDGHVVPLTHRVTEANVKGIGLIRQLLGSVGRMDAGTLLGSSSPDN